MIQLVESVVIDDELNIKHTFAFGSVKHFSTLLFPGYFKKKKHEQADAPYCLCII